MRTFKLARTTCTGLPSRPSPCCLQPTHGWEKAQRCNSPQYTVIMCETPKFARSSEQQHRSSCCIDTKKRHCLLACSMGEDAQVLLPPAVDESALSHSPRLFAKLHRWVLLVFVQQCLSYRLRSAAPGPDRNMRARWPDLLSLSTGFGHCDSHIGGERLPPCLFPRTCSTTSPIPLSEAPVDGLAACVPVSVRKRWSSTCYRPHWRCR